MGVEYADASRSIFRPACGDGYQTVQVGVRRASGEGGWAWGRCVEWGIRERWSALQLASLDQPRDTHVQNMQHVYYRCISLSCGGWGAASPS
eukprot:scaffold209750_cov22-Tisochrysis_lutea.AAC.1